MTAPWSTDRGELDEPSVRATIEAQFPALHGAPLRFLARGWDHDAWLADASWVFRFPRRRDVAEAVPVQIELSHHLSDALPVPVPRAALLGSAGAGFPYPFVGHRMLRGVGLDSLALTESDLAALAREIGHALAALHAIPLARVAALGLPELRDRSAERREGCIEVADAFRAAMAPARVAHWEPWLRGEIETPRPWDGTLRLTHNDLAAEHVLVDPETRRLSGILDWSDAVLGDPAMDFVGFWLWRGEPFVRQLLAHYAAQSDEATIARIRFHATNLALLYVGRAARFGDAALLDTERRWFLECFESHERSAAAGTA